MGGSEDKLFPVGAYKKVFNEILDIELPCKVIYQSTGLETHVERKHSNCIKYMLNISEIINKPDYIGLNPKEPNSIELVKRYSNLLI